MVCCVLPTPSEMLQVQGVNKKEMKLLGAMRPVRTEEEPRRYSNDLCVWDCQLQCVCMLHTDTESAVVGCTYLCLHTTSTCSLTCMHHKQLSGIPKPWTSTALIWSLKLTRCSRRPLQHLMREELKDCCLITYALSMQHLIHSLLRLVC